MPNGQSTRADPGESGSGRVRANFKVYYRTNFRTSCDQRVRSDDVHFPSTTRKGSGKWSRHSPPVPVFAFFSNSRYSTPTPSCTLMSILQKQLRTEVRKKNDWGVCACTKDPCLAYYLAAFALVRYEQHDTFVRPTYYSIASEARTSQATIIDNERDRF